ncbi:hypothetical protein [Paenibacillus sp. SYP-B4298]|uniref:hypothetical protein n=1 Tax=Paenibacillus sp. SYP-B4298 TaxID=2996034 RepID=UPI0022DD8515|nr:hypothetical protein [Paenibacillus sp. SYP-B4298]
MFWLVVFQFMMGFKMLENREQLQELLKIANQHARKQAKELGASIYDLKNNIREYASEKVAEMPFF